MDIESRIGALEVDMSTVKVDVAVIRANYATKDDLTDLHVKLAVIHSNYVTRENMAKVAEDLESIKVNYATKKDLENAINKMTWKMYGFGTALVSVVYFIARTVH